MRRWVQRVAALVALAGGVAAAVAAIVSALGSSGQQVSAARAADATIRSHVAAFGRRRVAVRTSPGRICFTIWDGRGNGRGCTTSTGPNDIDYALSPRGIGGVAGANVRAVIVKLTHKGTIWAPLADGAFYTDVPAGRRVRAVIKVLRGGTRTTFRITASSR